MANFAVAFGFRSRLDKRMHFWRRSRSLTLLSILVAYPTKLLMQAMVGFNRMSFGKMRPLLQRHDPTSLSFWTHCARRSQKFRRSWA